MRLSLSVLPAPNLAAAPKPSTTLPTPAPPAASKPPPPAPAALWRHPGGERAPCRARRSACREVPTPFRWLPGQRLMRHSGDLGPPASKLPLPPPLARWPCPHPRPDSVFTATAPIPTVLQPPVGELIWPQTGGNGNTCSIEYGVETWLVVKSEETRPGGLFHATASNTTGHMYGPEGGFLCPDGPRVTSVLFTCNVLLAGDEIVGEAWTSC